MVRVLIVDDKPDDLMRTRAEVERRLSGDLGNRVEMLNAGVRHEIAEANDGKPALELYKRAKDAGKPFDIIVSDFNMNFDGGWLMREIRRTEGDAEIPFVIVSAFEDKAEQESTTRCVAAYKPTAVLHKDEVQMGFSDEFKAIMAEVVARKQETKATLPSGGGMSTGTQGEERHFRKGWRSAFGARTRPRNPRARARRHTI